MFFKSYHLEVAASSVFAYSDFHAVTLRTNLIDSRNPRAGHVINYLNMLVVTGENGVHESHIARFLCKKRFVLWWHRAIT